MMMMMIDDDDNEDDVAIQTGSALGIWPNMNLLETNRLVKHK